MIDWQLLTSLLKGAGLTQKEINRATGVSVSTIAHLSAGSMPEPRFSDGVKLVDCAYDVLKPEQFARIRQ